tara:strand:+ start:420 stop:527 length:108 start_codon:yes stop_codon:yes gene_type:complete
MVPQYEKAFTRLTGQNMLDIKNEDLVEYVIRVFEC